MRCRSSGFTYLEVLISLALLAIMSISLASSLNFGRQAWHRTLNVAQSAEYAIVRSDIRRWLQSIDGESEFIGNETGFTFEISASDLWQIGVYKREVNLNIEVSENSGSIIIETTDLDFSGAIVGKQLRNLATDLKGIDIQYFGRQGPGQPLKWSSNWSGPQAKLHFVKLVAEKRSDLPWPFLGVVIGNSVYQRKISASSLVPPD